MRVSPHPKYPDPALGLERIGTPYTPVRLEELGHLPEIAACPASFEPAVRWSGSFRIFGGHGFVGVRNWIIGCLQIDAAVEDDRWVVSVGQDVAYAGGIVHTLTAKADCGGDPLLSLREWELSSRVSRTDGSPQPELDLDTRFQLIDRVLVKETNGRRTEIGVSAPPVGDWPLFAAVQRLPFDATDYPDFDFADGLSVVKPGHTVSFAKNRTELLAQNGLELRCFTQIGSGTLPYEYWLDEDHRLIAVITGNRTYLLDEGAGSVFDTCVVSLRSGDGYVS